MNHFGYIANSHLSRVGDRYFYNTGEWNYLQCMARHASKVDVFSLIQEKEPSEGSTFLDQEQICIHEIPRRSYLRTGFGFRKHAPKWNFCFLMAPSWYSYGAYLGCRKNDVPFAVCFRGDWRNRARLESRCKPIMKPLSAMAESQFIRDASIRMGEGGLLKDRYTEYADQILPCLTTDIPQEIFQKGGKPPFQDGVISILFVGNLIPLKGIDILLKAVAEIKKTTPIRLAIAGKGPLEGKLRSLVSELNLSEEVRFTGQIPFPKLLEEYRAADCFVLPSYSEGFPRVVLEAFSQSRPVITTPVGAQKIALKDQEHCLFFTPGNTEELKSCILKLKSDQEFANTIAQNGFRFAEDLFANHPVKEFESQLLDVLSARAASK